MKRPWPRTCSHTCTLYTHVTHLHTCTLYTTFPASSDISFVHYTVDRVPLQLTVFPHGRHGQGSQLVQEAAAVECLLRLKKELQDATASAKSTGRLLRTPAGRVDYTDDFFGRPAYLTVSGQLQAECAASALTDVYTFGM